MNKEPLINALNRRLAVIADHAWRERDPAGHLNALRQASEEITSLQTSVGNAVPPRLRHFLENCSYDKALAFLTDPSNSKPA